MNRMIRIRQTIGYMIVGAVLVASTGWALARSNLDSQPAAAAEKATPSAEQPPKEATPAKEAEPSQATPVKAETQPAEKQEPAESKESGKAESQPAETQAAEKPQAKPAVESPPAASHSQEQAEAPGVKESAEKPPTPGKEAADAETPKQQPAPAQSEAKPATEPPAEQTQQPAPAKDMPTQPAAEKKAAPEVEPKPQEAAKTSESQKPEPAAEKAAPSPQGEALSPADMLRVLGQIPVAEQGKFLAIGDISQVKHYSQEALAGFGLAVELSEIVPQQSQARAVLPEGESAEPGTVQLSQLLTLLTEPIDTTEPTSGVAQQLWESGKLRLVWVTAAVPPEGARKGDLLECQVKAFDSRSLDGCYLLPTKLYGAGNRNDAPLAVAAGPIGAESSYRAAGAKLSGGCLAEADICDQFIIDDKFTLVLDEEHADFRTAQEIADRINLQIGAVIKQPLAKALNRFQIEVTVPAPFADDPVLFITQVLRLPTGIELPEEEKSP